MKNSFTGLFFLLLAWVIASLLLPLSKWLLPDVFGVLHALNGMLWSGELPFHLYQTLLRVMGGVAISILIGVPLGLLLSLSGRLGKAVMPVLDFFRSIPIAMLFPAFIILFGIGEFARTLMVLYLGLPIILVSVYIGASERIEVRGRRQYLRVHQKQISPFIRWVSLLWDALPAVVAGTKFTISVGVVVIIVSEMFFVSSAGLGWAAYQAYNSFNISKMYAFVLVAGLLGYIANLVFDGIIAWLERQDSHA